MKTNSALLLLVLAAAAPALRAQPAAADAGTPAAPGPVNVGSLEKLATDTAVFVQADPKSPVITRLKAGTAVHYVGEAPAGWRRVEITGTFEAYAHSRDISKGLEVNEGAKIYAAPAKNSPVLTVAQKGDKTEVTGLHGDFCQIRLEKTLQGFVATGAVANTPPEIPKSLLATTAPPAAPVASPTAGPGRPVPVSGNTADMPRLFSGRFLSARRPLINPNPLYDYQLADANGRRFAYVDTKRLVLTERIESYLGLVVVINGTVRNTVDGKDLVIEAETISTK
jgi:hypothetical protein